jgi:hypothetical protein
VQRCTLPVIDPRLFRRGYGAARRPYQFRNLG